GTTIVTRDTAALSREEHHSATGKSEYSFRCPSIFSQETVMLRFRHFVLIAAIALSAYPQVHQFNFRPAPNAGNCFFNIVSLANALKCDANLDRGASTNCAVTFMNTGTDA